MDRSWIDTKIRWGSAYIEGVKEFMECAKKHATGTKTRCPCKKCRNVYLWEFHEIEDHLYEHGFLTTYTKWAHHGERRYESDGDTDYEGGEEEADEVGEEDDLLGNTDYV